MDPVKISSPIDTIVGRSLWIPFEAFHIQRNGKCRRVLAKDLPIFATKDEVLKFINNNPSLSGRALDWIEFQNKEIMRIPKLHDFVKESYVNERRSPLQ